MKPILVKEKVTLKAIEQLIERSVSKLATKNELNNAFTKLATKDELNNAVSKLATKDEMNMSIDNLAGAVKKGFDEVNEKIEKIEFKIERMDTRFTNQLDNISLWYPTKYEFTLLDSRVKKIENKIGIKA